MITIKPVSNNSELKKAQEIRHIVFVIGQNVPVGDDIDAFETKSDHYLAFFNNQTVGTARWRFTENGIKLERFAVLDEYRGRGIGSALLKYMLSDISKNPESKNKTIYLHAQIDAMRLYKKFGFFKEGDIFDESGILHYKMIKS